MLKNTNSPIQINKGIIRIIESLNDSIKEETLEYYKQRIQTELNRLEYCLNMPGLSIMIQKDIHDDMIPTLQNAIEKIDSFVTTHKQNNFSELTNRLNRINRCK